MKDGDSGSLHNRRQILKIAVPVIVVVAMVISTGVFLYNFNGHSFDPRDRQILIVPTGSMDGEPLPYDIPTIPTHSLIMVHLLSDDEKKELSIGDVISFRQDGIEKVHRIVDIKTDGTVITKGDANKTSDPAITADDIDGKVIGVAPVVGEIVSAVRDFTIRSPILIVIGVILLIIFVYSVIEVVRIVRKGDDEEEKKTNP